MSTGTITPTKPSLYTGITVKYPGADAAIEYRYETSEGTTPRVLKLIATVNDCILYFTSPANFGLSYLVLRKGVAKLLCIPDNVQVDFEVYSKVAVTHNPSEPPPIRT